MIDREFRFAYFTRAYDATVAFYRDDLGFPIVDAWTRTQEDRGTIFRASAGMIEVLSGAHAHAFDPRPPQGAFMVIELELVGPLYQRVQERGLPIHQELTDQIWGHRSFCVREPNGLTLYIFQRLDH